MQGQYTPVAHPPMSKDEALAFVAWAKDAQDELVRRVYDAYNRQAHLALGYASWEEMCSGQDLGFYKLPRDKRAPAVVQLKDHGMSNRAIGQALGYDEGTIRNDLRPRSKGAENSALNDQGRKREDPTIGGIKFPSEDQDRLNRARSKVLQAAMLLETSDGRWDLLRQEARKVADLIKEEANDAATHDQASA